MVRRIFEWSPVGKRSRVHPRNRWRVEVLKDIRVLVVKNWTKVVMETDRPSIIWWRSQKPIEGCRTKEE
jgi:hypothetical protein